MFVQMLMGNVYTHLWLKETNNDNITGYPHGCSNIFLLFERADVWNDDNAGGESVPKTYGWGSPT